MKDISKEIAKYNIPFMHDALDSHLKQLAKRFNNELEDYIFKNLMQLGLSFENPNEFIDFCSKHLHRISYQDKPDYYEFWLHYDNDEKRKFVGTYSQNIKTHLEAGGRVSISFGD